LKTTAEEPPDVGGVTPRTPDEFTPEPAGAPPAALNASRAVPPERPESHVEGPLDQSKADADAKMAELGLPDPEGTLARSNEPEFQAALEAKHTLEADVEQGKSEFRTGEQGTLEATK